MFATSSTSLRGQPSIVTAPRGAPTTVTVPPKAKRRVSRRVVVRFSKLEGNDSAGLFCCEKAVRGSDDASNTTSKDVTTNSRNTDYVPSADLQRRAGL